MYSYLQLLIFKMFKTDISDCAVLLYSVLQGKAIPAQDWTGLYGSRWLRLPEFLESQHMKVVKL
jgi:hypothetical protein